MINVDIAYSIYNKKFNFTANGNKYDISNEVPDGVWNITNNKFPTDIEDDWKIRVLLRIIFIDYFKKNIDENIKENEIIF